MEEIKQRIIKVLCQIINVGEAQISGVDKFTEIENWDSLNHLYVVLELEKEFGIKFEIQETANISSISNVSQLIHGKLS